MLSQAYDSRSRADVSNGHAQTEDGNLVIFETALWGRWLVALPQDSRKCPGSYCAPLAFGGSARGLDIKASSGPASEDAQDGTRRGFGVASEDRAQYTRVMLFRSRRESWEITTVKNVIIDHYLFSALRIYRTLTVCRSVYRRLGEIGFKWPRTP